VAEMCAYADKEWPRPAVHLASYLMWRLNWIHPFFGGNGRTARAVSYLVLSAKLEFTLPGTKMIPELIVEHRAAYVEALRAADSAWQEQRVDVSKMEDLMASLLAYQLVEIHQRATGKPAVPGS
jgi:Fic family protein